MDGHQRGRPSPCCSRLSRSRFANHRPKIGTHPRAPGDAEALAARCRDALDSVIDRCRVGAKGADLRSDNADILVHGLGLGAEPPVIGAHAGADAVLVSDMVLSVQAWVAEEGTGGVLLRDVVHLVDGTPRVLTRYRSALC